MPPRRNPLKLNKLQLRTLALAQLLANDPRSGARDEATGEITLHSLPQPHGDHVHVADIVVSARDVSGFGNPAVWTALQRKGLVRPGGPVGVVLTAEGVAYDTGLMERRKQPT
jgi:hypothetical protein